MPRYIYVIIPLSFLFYFVLKFTRKKLFFSFANIGYSEHVFYIALSLTIMFLVMISTNIAVPYYVLIICFLLSIICYICSQIHINDEIDEYIKKQEKQLQDDFKKKEEFVNGFLLSEKENLKKERTIIQEREDFVNGVINGDDYIFNKIPSFVADMQAYDFSITEKYLHTKKHPAHKKAEEVGDLKKRYRQAVIEAKVATYKLQALVGLFPELENFIDEEANLNALNEYISLSDIQDDYDRVRFYISKDEYNNKTITERNQLALDRYINRNKSKEEIGAEYESCCARVLEKVFGYKVIEHGALYGLKDLGRDLICFDNINSCTYIVQCKYWGKERLIRENVIMQLYGSAVAYSVSYNSTQKSIFGSKIIPVLMIPPTSVISDTAKDFIKILGIQVWEQKLLNDFPRIKCNINNGNKIYHLPFDQQYKRTIIDKPGEFYACNVKEAEDAGFRRAMRHYISE